MKRNKIKNKIKTNGKATLFVSLLGLMASLYVSYITKNIEFETYIDDGSVSIELHKKIVYRQEFLKGLRFCESSNRNHKIGDGGASIGPYQWQKPSLEDVLGYKMTYDTYYSIVTDLDQITSITYDVIFNKDQLWRWKTCGNKVTKQLQ